MQVRDFLKNLKEFIKVVAIDDSSYLEKKEKRKEIIDGCKLSPFERKTLRFFKSSAYFGVAVMAVFSSYEAWRVYSEYCDKLEAVSNLQYVSQQLYYKDSAADVSLELLKKTEEMDENNIKTKYIRAFIESMVIADKLLDLDREYNAAELKEAQYALANAEFLIEDARRGDSSGTFRGLVYNLLGFSGSDYEADGFFTRSQIYLALKDYKRAMENINQALVLVNDEDEKKIYFQIRKATIMIEQDQTKEAISLLQKYQALLEAKELTPKDKIFLAQVYNWLGVANLKELGKKSEIANEYFVKALKIDDKFLDGLYNYAEYLVDKLNENSPVDEIFVVEEYIQRMLRVNPEYKYAYYLWAYMYGKIDQYDIAEKYCDIALGIDSGYFDATLLKSRIMYEKKDYSAALASIDQALSFQPKNVKAHYRKGVIETLNNNTKDAIKAFDYVIYFGKESEQKSVYYAACKKAELQLLNKDLKNFSETLKMIEERFHSFIDYRYWMLKYDFCSLIKDKTCLSKSKEELAKILNSKEFSSKSISKKIQAKLNTNK